MTDHTHLVSRRNALKGIAALGGTSAAGAGAILHASEPAAASSHVMEIDDITIGLNAAEGEPIGLTEIGISDIWFEIRWENIEYGLRGNFGWLTPAYGTQLASLRLHIDGEGTETFGYGDVYQSSYDIDLDGQSYLDGSAPMRVSLPTSNPLDEDVITQYQLESSQNEKTVATEFFISLVELDEDGSPGELLDNTDATFDVTLQRTEPDAGANEGEAVVYGED